MAKIELRIPFQRPIRFLPETDYPRASRSFPRIAGSGNEIDGDEAGQVARSRTLLHTEPILSRDESQISGGVWRAPSGAAWVYLFLNSIIETILYFSNENPQWSNLQP